MKKLLPLGAVLVGTLLPMLAFAAYNDVTLTSSVSIQADGQTINVTGDANVVEQMVVYGDTFTFTLDINSDVTVTSASNKKLEHNAASAHVVNSICESGNSSIHFKGTADDITVTVTPKNTTCPEGSGSSSGGSSSGGGGGTTATVVASPVVAAPTSNAALIASLQAQLNALLAQLAALQGAPAPTGVGVKAVITANLSAGSRGASVKSLQQFLNTHGFVIASSGPGSLGNETELFGSLTVKAVQKFQEQYGIASPGTTGYGRVGPKTRAKINELSGN